MLHYKQCAILLFNVYRVLSVILKAQKVQYFDMKCRAHTLNRNEIQILEQLFIPSDSNPRNIMYMYVRFKRADELVLHHQIYLQCRFLHVLAVDAGQDTTHSFYEVKLLNTHNLSK